MQAFLLRAWGFSFGLKELPESTANGKQPLKTKQKAVVSPPLYELSKLLLNPHIPASLNVTIAGKSSPCASLCFNTLMCFSPAMSYPSYFSSDEGCLEMAMKMPPLQMHTLP